MKSLILISISNSIKKIFSSAEKIAILNTSQTLVIGNKAILQGVYDFIIDNEYIYLTEKETSDLVIFQNEIMYKKIVGEFYLASIKNVQKDFFLIANGYDEDGFHFKYEICDKKIFSFNSFFGFNFCLDGKFFIDKGLRIEVLDKKQSLLWQTDISHYGTRRTDHHGRELDSSTPNVIDGELIGYDDTVVVPLKGGQLLGLNISDGSFKWLLERGANRLLTYSGQYLYSYCDGIWSEIEIRTGRTVRRLDLNPFLERIDNHIFYSAVSNGKMILDFNNNYSCLAVIDLEKLELEAFIENEYRSMMLRVSYGDVIWHDNKLYARDPISNTLYVFGE